MTACVADFIDIGHNIRLCNDGKEVGIKVIHKAGPCCVVFRTVKVITWAPPSSLISFAVEPLSNPGLAPAVVAIADTLCMVNRPECRKVGASSAFRKGNCFESCRVCWFRVGCNTTCRQVCIPFRVFCEANLAASGNYFSCCKLPCFRPSGFARVCPVCVSNTSR